MRKNAADYFPAQLLDFPFFLEDGGTMNRRKSIPGASLYIRIRISPRRRRSG